MEHQRPPDPPDPPDLVNNPPHYTSGAIEVIDFVEDQQLGYHLGNVIKYVCRAGKKHPETFLEDLKKARWYLNRMITNVERGAEEVNALRELMGG